MIITKDKKLFIICFLLITIFATIVVGMISNNYWIFHKVLDSGDNGTSSSTSYLSRASIGQVTSGKVESSSYKNFIGFIRLSEEEAGETPVTPTEIYGKITELDGIIPIYSANVKLCLNDDTEIKNTTTDISGDYIIENISLNTTYYLTVSKTDYSSDKRTDILLTQLVSQKEVNFKLTSLPDDPDPIKPVDSIVRLGEGQKAEFRYNVVQSGDVEINILDSSGKTIKTLVNEYKSQSSDFVAWNADNEDGATVGSGIYYVRLKDSNGRIYIKKIAIIK